MKLVSKLAAVIAVSQFALASCALAADVKIGVIGPLSGAAANTGISMRQAYELAAKEVNGKGGVSVDGEKRQVKLIFEDSASRPEMGVSAAQKLLTRDNVDIVVGDSLASSVTLAIMEVVPSFGKFMMSGQPVSIDIANKIKNDPKKYANVWKSAFNSDAYGQTVYDSINELVSSGKMKITGKKISFIVEDTDYGKSNVEYIMALFKKNGWSQTSYDVVPLGQADFYPQISKLRGDPPGVLISVFTSVNSGVALVKQLKEQGVDVPHLAVYYPIRDEFLQGAGASADGLLWTPMLFDPVNNPKHKAFSESFKAATGIPGNGDHAMGYCQMSMLLDNVNKAGSVDPAKLSAAFAKTDFSCVSGRYVYDVENHTPKVGAEFLSVPVAQIQNGKNLVIWPATVATAQYKGK